MARVGRWAFLYQDPKSPKKQYAQCSTCMMWTTAKHDTCTIHGPKVKVTGDMTCGAYAHGMPMEEGASHEVASFTPEESGLEKRQVRCENCVFFSVKDSKCMLYVILNKMLPNIFDLDENVNEFGCCTANTPNG